MKKITKPLNALSQIALRLIILVLAVGAIDRFIFIFVSGPSMLEMSAVQYPMAFLFGAVNDLGFAIIGLVFLWVFCITVTDAKFSKPTGYIFLAVLTLATVYLTWFCTPLHDFNRGFARVICWLMFYWTLVFALRLFIPRMRRIWTRIWLGIILFIYIVVIYFNGISEFFFWSEFEVRYNFIAVDYLVYTSEVIGNIMESYPIIPLAIAIIIAAGATELVLFRGVLRNSDVLYAKYPRSGVSFAYLLAAGASYGVMLLMTGLQNTENTYYNELQANGPYRFADAFFKNRLDYKQFYLSIPDNEIDGILQVMEADSVEAKADTALFAVKPNIVLITMESMSADFMKRYGEDEVLTPTLDSLYERGIAFDRMIANGNRTVRGLEALSLSLPPSAGQSLIKRSDFVPGKSVGSILREHGYRTTFLYGGKSYFDNMGPYFRNAGYEVVDIADFTSEEITFKNIWGLCDENTYAKALKIIDEQAAKEEPMFLHMMTISNHRPYTYPEGRIDIPADSKTRSGGVKYSDYALGWFMGEAAKKSWFDNTLFVIIADHCASSAGATELPLDKYHIPAVIYAPGHIEPRIVEHIVSQIDVMPTVLALAGIENPEGLNYGRNIFSGSYRPRAFLATYQDLGYVEDDVLTVLSPVKRVRQYRVDMASSDMPLTPMETLDTTLVNRAVSLYQSSAEAE